MGLSYVRNLNKGIDDTLFHFDINCRVVYNKDLSVVPYGQGYLMSYALNSNSMEKKYISRLIDLLLIEMTRRKYFRRFDLRLSHRTTATFSLFCEEYAFDAVKTFIRMFFDRYALDNKLFDFECISDHRYITTSVNSDDEPLYPTRMATANEMLITAHDKINVTEDRVRIVKHPGGFKKQTETFPERVHR